MLYVLRVGFRLVTVMGIVMLLNMKSYEFTYKASARFLTSIVVSY